MKVQLVGFANRPPERISYLQAYLEQGPGLVSHLIILNAQQVGFVDVLVPDWPDMEPFRLNFRATNPENCARKICNHLKESKAGRFILPGL